MNTDSKDNKVKKTAVALSYKADEDAPKVIASGKGYLADKIISRAKERGIPIHKDDELTQNLSKIEIGHYIPQELYEVVAEIMVFIEDIDRLKQKIDGGLH
ncbi:MAG: flagellar biosynthesis protein FlhB [Clostridiales bacterium]|nr:flagellar biosynthesis protein FlhB [Clostridiales bacterium]